MAFLHDGNNRPEQSLYVWFSHKRSVFEQRWKNERGSQTLILELMFKNTLWASEIAQ